MLTDPWLCWLLTWLFVICGAGSVWLTIDSRWHVPRVGYAWHALMNLAMIAMLWPWGQHLAPVAQSVFFCLATLWFIVVSLAQMTGRRRLADRVHPLWHNIYHAAMMAAMAWMLLDMAHMADMMMHGMAMHGGDMAMSMPAHMAHAWSPRRLGNVVGLLVMLLGVVLFATRAVMIRPAASRSACGNWIEALSIGGMSAGMAVMFAAAV